MKKVLASLIKYPLRLLSILPFSIIYILSDLLYGVIYHIIGYRKQVVRTNLLNSFPNKSEQERRSIEKRYFHFLADMLMESIKMISISKDELRKRYVIENPEEVEKYFKKGQSVILITGHYGNWEWGALRCSYEFNNPFLIIYKPLTDKDVELAINQARSRFGAVMISMKNTMRSMVSYKDQAFWTAFLGDQTPVPREIHFYDTFLNQRTPIFLGSEKMAKLTNAAVVFGYNNRVKRGYYTVRFKSITDSPRETEEYEITRTHTRLLDQTIQQCPELWLWSHKRWKYVK